MTVTKVSDDDEVQCVLSWSPATPFLYLYIDGSGECCKGANSNAAVSLYPLMIAFNKCYLYFLNVCVFVSTGLDFLFLLSCIAGGGGAIGDL